jgi:hypothetical protein
MHVLHNTLCIGMAVGRVWCAVPTLAPLWLWLARLEDGDEGVGLELAEDEETAKYFPASNSSTDVRDSLVRACSRCAGGGASARSGGPCSKGDVCGGGLGHAAGVSCGRAQALITIKTQQCGASSTEGQVATWRAHGKATTECTRMKRCPVVLCTGWECILSTMQAWRP